MPTYAHDSASEVQYLRSRLRAAGVPVGPHGSLRDLRTLAASSLPPGMAFDSASDNAAEFARLFPSVAKRFAMMDRSNVFAVVTGAESRSEAERASQARHGGMAMDARGGGREATESEMRALLGSSFDAFNRIKIAR